MARRPRPVDPALGTQPFSTAAGLERETRRRLQGAAYQRLTRGAYWVGTGAVDHGRRIQAVRAVLGPDVVLGGKSAAWVLGARFADPDDPVEVVLAPTNRVRCRAELLVRGDLLGRGETVTTRFGPATSVARTAFDLARRGDPADALAWADAVLRAGAGAAEDAAAVALTHPGVRGVLQAREVLALADPRAESLQESRLRWVVLAAGLPAPVPQCEVRDGDGLFVARLDLAWPRRRVGLEYDGAHHRDPGRHSADLARHNRLRASGWVVVQVDASALCRPGRLLAQLTTILG